MSSLISKQLKVPCLRPPSGPVSLSVNFSTSKPYLTSLLQGYSDLPALDQVTVLGVSGTPTKATLNGAAVSGFSFDSSQHILTLTGLMVC